MPFNVFSWYNWNRLEVKLNYSAFSKGNEKICIVLRGIQLIKPLGTALINLFHPLVTDCWHFDWIQAIDLASMYKKERWFSSYSTFKHTQDCTQHCVYNTIHVQILAQAPDQDILVK